MKNLEQIISDIKVTADYINENKGSDIITKTDYKKLELFRKCKLYLETNPTEEFVNKEMEGVTKKYQAALKARPWWDKSGKLPDENKEAERKRDYDKDVADWKKEYDVSDLRRHQKTLKYLLY